jgi:hypothetical protein
LSLIEPKSRKILNIKAVGTFISFLKRVKT